MKLYSLSYYLELKNKDDLRLMTTVMLLRLSWWIMIPLLLGLQSNSLL